LSSVIGAIGSLMRGPAIGLVHFGLGCARHPGLIAARRALAAGVGRLAGAESSTRRDVHNHTAQALTEHGQPPPQDFAESKPPLNSAEDKPPLSAAEEHGLDAVRAALTPPKQGRPLTRDQAKRLLDCLEGR
jgi:hypothetical protein